MQNWLNRRPVDAGALLREMEALGPEMERVIALYQDLALLERLQSEHGTDLRALRDQWQWECEQFAVLLDTARRSGDLERWQNSRGARREERKRRASLDAMKARIWKLKTLAPELHRKKKPPGP